MFARQAHIPAHNLICIPPAWPFSYWGLNQVGPLKKAKGGFEYIFVAIDKFTKWIEYKPLTKYSVAKTTNVVFWMRPCTYTGCVGYTRVLMMSTPSPAGLLVDGDRYGSVDASVICEASWSM